MNAIDIDIVMNAAIVDFGVVDSRLASSAVGKSDLVDEDSEKYFAGKMHVFYPTGIKSGIDLYVLP